MSNEVVIGLASAVVGGVVINVLGGFAFRWTDDGVSRFGRRRRARRQARREAMEADAATLTFGLQIRLRNVDAYLETALLMSVALFLVLITVGVLLALVAMGWQGAWWTVGVLVAPGFLAGSLLVMVALGELMTHERTVSIARERLIAGEGEAEDPS